MCPQCQYLRPGNQICRAVALKGSRWCYHHARLHQRYRAQQARYRLHNQRDASGRFTPAHVETPKADSLDPRPRQPSRPHPAPADPGLAAAASAPHLPALSSLFPRGEAESCERPTRTSRHRLPVPSSLFPDGEACHHPPLNLPPIADTASIQHALTGILQALAANQLDPKRASVLLYGLQVACTYAKQTHTQQATDTATYTNAATV